MSDPIAMINKDTFWELLAQAKTRCGQDLDASALWLESELQRMGPEQARNFDNIMHGYSSLAYKFGLWTAYEKLERELARDIEYDEGIGYPYTWSEAADYLPRLCKKYLTPEDLTAMIRHHNDIWNPTSQEVQQARETAPKSKKVKDRGDTR